MATPGRVFPFPSQIFQSYFLITLFVNHHQVSFTNFLSLFKFVRFSYAAKRRNSKRFVIDIQIGMIRQPKMYSWLFFSDFIEKRRQKKSWMIVIWSEHVFTKIFSKRIFRFTYFRSPKKNKISYEQNFQDQLGCRERSKLINLTSWHDRFGRICLNTNSRLYINTNRFEYLLNVERAENSQMLSQTTNMCEHRIYKMITCVLNPNNVSSSSSFCWSFG